jgi:hypothetical protein
MLESEPYDVEIKEWLAEKEALPTTFKAHIARESKKALLLRIIANGVERGEYWIPRSAIVKIEG